MIATALEPILLDVDLTVEEYDLEIDDGASYDVELDTVIKVITITGDMYDGAYQAIPTFEDQVFMTKNKTMRNDFEVVQIPVSRTANPQGGNTVFIGG